MQNTATKYNDGDFIELLLRHLYCSKAVCEHAISVGLTGDDMLANDDYGLRVYKILADIILTEIKSAPVSLQLFATLVNVGIKSGAIPSDSKDQLFDLVTSFYSPEPLTESYFLAEIVPYLKYRRGSKIITAAQGDIAKINEEYAKLIIPLDFGAEAQQVRESVVFPFQQLLRKRIFSLLPTGYTNLNAALGGGLGYRELGIILGFSGAGKTSMGVSIARGAALEGFPVLYISMEEEKEDIANRLYSSLFEISYTGLHSGTSIMELEQKFRDFDESKKLEILKKNWCLMDLKGKTPISAKKLKALIDKLPEEQGFIPKLIIGDQLQFLEPNTVIAGEQEWQRERRIVEEIDQVSHQPIGDTGQYFGMWWLHQAKGKLKLYFSTEDISGFKGIIHKPETMLGLGRENPISTDFEVFSMKSRHSKNFRIPLTGDLEYQRFNEKVIKTEANGEVFVLPKTVEPPVVKQETPHASNPMAS